MKRIRSQLLAGVLAAVACLALAGTTETVVIDPPDLFKGSSKIGTFETMDKCLARIRELQQLEVSKSPTSPQVYKARCRAETNMVLEHAPDDGPPPAEPPPPPTDHSGHFGIRLDPASIPPPNANPSQVFSTVRVKNTTSTPDMTEGRTQGAWRTGCFFSHVAYDDPIVFPGQKGRSHAHVFYGNTSTDAFSTVDSLMSAPSSTCKGGLYNSTAYWMPALAEIGAGVDGLQVAKFVMPVDALSSFYYKTPAGVNGKDVKPLPRGLMMVAGNAMNAENKYQSHRWTCEGIDPATGVRVDSYYGQQDPKGHQIPNCPAGTQLKAWVFFPGCWDGKNLDSPDHKSHMAYSQAPTTKVGAVIGCPATHPVPVPHITLMVSYKVERKDQTLSWRLVSDAYDGKPDEWGRSLHADWFNGWRGPSGKAGATDAEAQPWVASCLNKNWDAHSNLLCTLPQSTTLY